MGVELKNGETLTADNINAILRPATKRLNRISDLNVRCITTGQLRDGDNGITILGVQQFGNNRIDLMPNTAGLQVLLNRSTAFDILYRIKKDIEYIEKMVV